MLSDTEGNYEQIINLSTVGESATAACTKNTVQTPKHCALSQNILATGMKKQAFGRAKQKNSQSVIRLRQYH